MSRFIGIYLHARVHAQAHRTSDPLRLGMYPEHISVEMGIRLHNPNSTRKSGIHLSHLLTCLESNFVSTVFYNTDNSTPNGQLSKLQKYQFYKKMKALGQNKIPCAPTFQSVECSRKGGVTLRHKSWASGTSGGDGQSLARLSGSGRVKDRHPAFSPHPWLRLSPSQVCSGCAAVRTGWDLLLVHIFWQDSQKLDVGDSGRAGKTRPGDSDDHGPLEVARCPLVLSTAGIYFSSAINF